MDQSIVKLLSIPLSFVYVQLIPNVSVAQLARRYRAGVCFDASSGIGGKEQNENLQNLCESKEFKSR